MSIAVEGSRSETSRWAFGLTTLLLGVVALGSAITLTVVFEVPPPWKPAEPALVQAKLEGQKQIEWRGVKFAWGGKLVKEEPKAKDVEMTPGKWLTLAVASVALLGLALGPLAWYRERRYALVVPGMSFCCLALTWQYVIFGIAVGAAAAMFLVVLAMFCHAAAA